MSANNDLTPAQRDTVDQLKTDLWDMLAKHEVHNEVLAIELAIFVLEREKTAIKDTWNKHMEALKTGEWKI